MDYVLDLDFAVFQMSAVTICTGILLAVILTIALFARRHEGITAPLALSVLGLLFGVLFSRFLHWYFNGEAYASFKAAFTDFNRGSYCLQGLFLGVWLAAFLAKKLRLTGSMSGLLDAAAPGLCLLVAFIRLSALFNTTCRGRITIKTPLLQHLPLAVASTDAAGNVTYRFATFFLAFLLMIVVTLVVWRFYLDDEERWMKWPCSGDGNTMRIALVLYGAVEIIMDSTRNDSPLMHFRFISQLNKFSAFISLAQIFAAVAILCVLIYYSRMSIKANGFKWYHPMLWIGFAVSLFGVGKLGEYNVQRYATYAKCYAWMGGSLILMAATAILAWRSCRETGEYIE